MGQGHARPRFALCGHIGIGEFFEMVHRLLLLEIICAAARIIHNTARHRTKAPIKHADSEVIAPYKVDRGRAPL